MLKFKMDILWLSLISLKVFCIHTRANLKWPQAFENNLELFISKTKINQKYPLIPLRPSQTFEKFWKSQR